MTKDELIAALEAATGPSRELDRHIARLIGWHRVEPRHTRSTHGAWIAPADWIGAMSDGSPMLDSLHGTTMHPDVPAYTASIDAALTLVPEGCEWSRHRGANDRMTMQVDGPGYIGRHGQGATPAIALCIAALRAWP